MEGRTVRSYCSLDCARNMAALHIHGPRGGRRGSSRASRPMHESAKGTVCQTVKYRRGDLYEHAKLRLSRRRVFVSLLFSFLTFSLCGVRPPFFVGSSLISACLPFPRTWRGVAVFVFSFCSQKGRQAQHRRSKKYSQFGPQRCPRQNGCRTLQGRCAACWKYSTCFGGVAFPSCSTCRRWILVLFLLVGCTTLSPQRCRFFLS